jgi:hypothetical protein
LGEYFLKLRLYLKFGWAQLVIEKLKPEDKVNLSISMTDACVHICADAAKDQGEAIKEDEIMERVRERIMYKKRRHHEV